MSLCLATTASAAPAPPEAVPTKPMQLGINVASSIYFGRERTFANLAFGAGAWRDPLAGWGDMVAAKLTADGYPIEGGVLPIVVPQAVWQGKPTKITCTWTGSGAVRFDGDTRAGGFGHKGTFDWPGRVGDKLPAMMVAVTGIDPRKPFGNLDCREAGVRAAGVFDQRLVDDLKRFSVLRFLDWSSANGNPAHVTWAGRTNPDRLTQGGQDGIALEHAIDLANAANADAWFTIPLNADDDYMRRAATLVRDRLSPAHRAYFELSNETWNFSFGAAGQLLNEGMAAKLSSDKYTNNLLRYAERSTGMFKILTEVFAPAPARLVRTINVQNGNAWATEQIMTFRDTAKWVDAVASAPYFGHDFFSGPRATMTDLPTLFAELETGRAQTIDQALQQKAMATRFGKRFIAYEGGQHVIAPAANAKTAEAMQRSPLMYATYQRYLADWRTRVGDTLVLYAATGGISQYGSWGIREYPGQPLEQAPKWRAALEYAR
jgi:hypothetical protein